MTSTNPSTGNARSDSTELSGTALAFQAQAEVSALTLALNAIEMLLDDEPVELPIAGQAAQDLAGAREQLSLMLNRRVRVTRLLDIVTGDGPVPCLCGQCETAETQRA